MFRVWMGVIGLALVVGCAPRSITLSDTVRQPRRTPPANLLFAGDPIENRLALSFADRAPNRAAYGGYVFTDEEHAAVVTFDDQVYYDRRGGGFGRAAESLRTRSVFR